MTSKREHQVGKILNFLRDAGPASRGQIVQATELDGNTVTRLLGALLDMGKVSKAGNTRGARWSAVA